MDVKVLMQYVTYGLALIGVLAFLVSIIVQVIKEMPGLNSIPTNIVALATALILLCTYYKVMIAWYYIVASVVGAFIVYLVATGGWERVKDIWDRTKYNKASGDE